MHMEMCGKVSSLDPRFAIFIDLRSARAGHQKFPKLAVIFSFVFARIRAINKIQPRDSFDS